MNRVNVETLIDVAKVFHKTLHEYDGVLGICETCEGDDIMPTVQLWSETFLQTFAIYEHKDRGDFDEIHICLDGVRFFALIEKEKKDGTKKL